MKKFEKIITKRKKYKQVQKIFSDDPGEGISGIECTIDTTPNKIVRVTQF